MSWIDDFFARNRFLGEITKLIIAQIIVAQGLKWIMKNIADPNAEQKKKAKERRKQLFEKLGLRAQELNEYEEIIATQIILPSTTSTSFNDIGGLEEVKEQIREAIVYPLTHPHIYSQSPLLSAPKGILLYGPPGTGKTLMAKAIATESGSNFLNIRMSTLLDKYLGESQRLVKAIFTLATKISPCIIFMDEIDAFLRSRTQDSHEATNSMRTEFMSLWDGLDTKSNDTDGFKSVVVIGATNRPYDLDSAVLRRMPRSFFLGLPDESTRLKILRVILSKDKLESSFQWNRIASATNGYSGSDLMELCKVAALKRVKPYMNYMNRKKNKHRNDDIIDDDIIDDDIFDDDDDDINFLNQSLPPLKTIDLLESMSDVTPTGIKAYEYLKKGDATSKEHYLSQLSKTAEIGKDEKIEKGTENENEINTTSTTTTTSSTTTISKSICNACSIECIDSNRGLYLDLGTSQVSLCKSCLLASGLTSAFQSGQFHNYNK